MGKKDSDAVGKELGQIGGPGSNGFVNPHYRVPSIRAKDSNNRVERLDGTEKERVKVMRGFDTDKGCAALAEGFRAHYNLVRDHEAIGMTPGDAAGIAPLTGFGWLDLVQKAAASPETLQPGAKEANHP